jgi:PAS domain S-box-containing protein
MDEPEAEADDELRRLRARVAELEALHARTARERIEDGVTIARLRQLADQATDSIFLHDEEGVIVEANRRAAEELGYREPELLGMRLHELEATLGGRDPDELAREWAAMELGVPLTWRGRVTRRDRTTFPAELRVVASVVDARRIFVTVMRDTSERETFDQALRESVKRFRFVFEGAPVGMITATAGGAILQANPALQEMLGHDLEAFRRLTLLDLPHEADRGRLRGEIAALAEWCARSPRPARMDRARGHVRREALLRTKRGDAIWAEVALFADCDGALRQILGVMVDVTERKRAETELAQLRGTLEAQVAARTRELAEAKEAAGARATRPTRDPARATLPTPSAEADGEGAVRSATVLVVDDDAEARALTRRALEAAGHEVVEARHGGEGLERARAKPPDLIVLDLLMPEMNGFAMLARLGLDPRLRGVPVAVLTGKDLTAEERALLAARCLRVLKKGVHGPDELLRLIPAALRAGVAPKRPSPSTPP